MSSRDILFIALSVCAVTLTVFSVWFLYYLISIVRDLRRTTQLLHDKVEQLGELLGMIKDRISDSAAALSLLTSIIGKIAGSWQDRRKKRSSSKSTIDDAS